MVLEVGGGLRCLPWVGVETVVELLYSPVGLAHVLRVTWLELFVSDVVCVRELCEVAADLRVSDLQRGGVRLQILYKRKEKVRVSFLF